MAARRRLGLLAKIAVSAATPTSTRYPVSTAPVITVGEDDIVSTSDARMLYPVRVTEVSPD